MVELLFTVFVIAIIFGLVYWLVQQLPLAEPFARIARVCVIVISILLLLGVVFGGVPFPFRVRY